MKQFVMVAVVLACAGIAGAQSLPYAENFDGGALPAGWTETHTSAGVPPVQWSVDATPGFVAGGTPTYSGTVGSLNYNDGADFADGLPNSGSATSPAISVGAATTIVVRFRCNYQTETVGTGFDTRTMQVLDGVSLAVISTQLCNSGGATTCAAMGTYHQHVYTVALPMGTTSVRIRFTFNTIDGILNAFAGWFVDNLSVGCTDALVPPAPTLTTPADAGFTSAPVILDWSDVTDTSDCGPGLIQEYEVEVDTTNPPLAPFSFFATPQASTATAAALVPGVYFWRVRAIDPAGNTSPYSAVFSFTVEPALAPLAADTLFVNETNDGAQNGDGGFVDPVVDEQPVFSAIYRDGNTMDTAASLQFEVTDDPTFATTLYNSGTVTLGVPLPDDSRCPDQQILITLNRDNVYYWRIRFTDIGGLLGPYSAAQSFRIGDDFDFGVRVGSSHRSRHGCWVATAAWGGTSEEVSRLAAFRSGVLESSGAGSWFSRAYAAAGRAPAAVVARSEARGAVKLTLAPLAAAAGNPMGAGALAAVVMALLLRFAFRRMQ